MAYCTITEVNGLNPQRTYGASTTPTQTEVEEFIDRIASEIDVILDGKGATTPVTTPANLVTFLKQLNALGAAAMAEQAMFPEARGQMTTPASAVLWARYREGLKLLMELELTGTGAVDLPFSFWTENLGQDEEPKNDYPWQRPKFEKNKEF